MRRGNEIDFDPDKMHPGEWAVSTDKKIIRMCFYPGVCVRMATYEAFEEDMKQIQSIISEARTIQEVVRRINTEVSSNAQAVAEYTKQAKQYRDEAKMYKEQASAIVGVDIATETIPGLMAGGDNMVDDSGALVLTRKTTDRTLNGSKDGGGVKINYIAGESQQNQYSGKNLQYNSATYEGWSAVNTTLENVITNETYNGGKVLKYTKPWQYIQPPVRLYKAGTYTISFDAKLDIDGNGTAYIYGLISNGMVVEGKTFKRYSSTFTITEDKEHRLTILMPSNHTYSELYIANIQVEQNSTMTEYEPYVGGIASPNPDYPQDIKSVVVSEIKGVGKNLCYNSDTYEGWLKANSGGTILGETYNGGKIAKYTISWNYRYPPSRLFKAGTYTISFDAKVKTNGSVYIYVVGLGVTAKNLWITASNTFSRHSYTYTLTEDRTGYIIPIIPTGSTVEELYIANIQIEEGSVATDYEPYQENFIQLSEPITLRGIGDVKDVLCKQDGVYGVLRKIGKWIITGSESWVKSNSRKGVFYITPSKIGEAAGFGTAKLSAEYFCSHLTYVDVSIYTVGHCSFDPVDNTYSFWFTNEDRTLDSFKTWLASNNVTVDYQLATPTFEPLPLADQIALHELETFDTVTYISTDSEIEPVMEVEYGTSKVGAYTIKALNNSEIALLKQEEFEKLTSEISAQLV